ncbi:hypothetical protein A3I51_06050 [Candidatus Gottesmanbacteria bacterium RIFCSPLOWO2_02_FULL_38_8]|uniref:Uncharacterized protein n=1 Tax=Candidatus Gottesmanbacteria bacterium RIFCSPLOWO2_02_FULL_38_8 TaxID=1798397 RepID=A0A1F6B6Q0_9BACT|nr:MAG: hypothetical protein A3I51_06050 [Candidatus Gottesmanbacteria bacterium RIFCSPLOWO2_02_FULL_38_8]
MKRGIIFLIIFTVGFLWLPGKAEGADVEVTCDSSYCMPANLPSFFEGEGVWYPGKSVIKTMKITNNSVSEQTLIIEDRNHQVINELDKAINFGVKEQGGSSLWSGTMDDFFNANEVVLSNIGANSFKEYELKFSLDQSVGSNYMDSSLSFDFVLGYQAPAPTATGAPEPSSSPTPTATPAPGTGAATSRFVIRNVINRQRIIVTLPPVLGVEVRDGSGSLPRGGDFWSLIQGASCRVWPYWYLLFALQLLLSMILAIRLRLTQLKMTVSGIGATGIIIYLLSQSFSCFPPMLAFWIILIVISLSFFYLKFRYRTV